MGRGGKERMNLPLLRELHAHVTRAVEPGGETAEEREQGEREKDQKRQGLQKSGRAIRRERESLSSRWSCFSS